MPRPRLVLALGLVASSIAPLWALSPAAAGPPFAVDDPKTVESGKGTLLFRYNLVRDQDQNTDSLPEVMLNLGLPAKLELAIDCAFLRPESSAGPDAGMSDLNVGLKWRFLEQDGAIPAIALDYTLSLPTGGPGLSADTVVHSPYLTLGWDLDDHWQVFGDIGANVSSSGPERPQFFAGLAIGYQATKSWLIGADFLGNTRVSNTRRSDLSIGLATQLDLSDSWTLMARVGRSISGTQALNAFVGIQLNF